MDMVDLDSLRRRAAVVFRRLAKLYPDAHCALNHDSPFQLLVATVLSAQCTDARVNLVTPALFARFPDPAAFATADLAEIENLIRSTGFFRNKAKNIQALSRALVEKHGGQVPGTLEELVRLPGVGRKTANVVLGDGFGIPGITVDTHVGRLSRRLGFTKQTDPVKAEHELMKVWKQADWTLYSHRLIFHGRQVCASRKPDCDHCTLADVCPKVGVPNKK
ncbi:MAG: endonuclease III [Gemmataceae bacterium]|nr:endonuclease III [Gemmataceae bacterium]